MTETMDPVDEAIDTELRAPFPWFGGKRRVAAEVWARFGNVATYNEPFAGSLAVLLGRPHAPRVETVNDLDCYLANFWRALQADPEAVAYYADGPVNEADLHARHRWLVDRGRKRVLRCRRDPHYFNAKIAGWWVWGQCLWIGSGWCQDARTDTMRKIRHQAGGRGVTALRFTGEHPSEQHKRPASSRSGTSVGVHRQQFDRNGLGTAHQNRRPHITKDQGVVASTKRPAANGNGNSGGVHRRWQGGGQGGGSGVHAPSLWNQPPDLSGSRGAVGRGVHRHGLAPSEGLYDYLEALAIRLRRVRVCCGDWPRVLTPSVTTYIGTTGVFLDPPYNHELRERCYAEDHDISADVRAWALEHGDDPLMRIALCGYEGEHAMPASWECVPWKAHGGYSRSARGVANRSRERVWFSPHCLKPGLF